MTVSSTPSAHEISSGFISQGMDTKPESSSEIIQFLTFTIGDEEYAVDIMKVREVKGWSETTRLPNSPEFMRGVLNLRGVVIPIFDLRQRFGFGLTQATDKHVIVIMAVGARICGLLVDAVSDILSISQEEIKASPEQDSAIDERFVSGLIAAENKMVVILDIEALLDSKLEALEKITADQTMPIKLD